MAGHTPAARSRVWVSKCKEVRSLACGRARQHIYCLSGAALHLKFMVQPLSQQRFQDPALVSRTAGVTLAIGMQGVVPRPPQPGGSFSSDPCSSHPCCSPAARCKAGLALSSDVSFQMKLPPVVKYENKKGKCGLCCNQALSVPCGSAPCMWLPTQVWQIPWPHPAPGTLCSKSPLHIPTLTPPREAPKPPKSW